MGVLLDRIAHEWQTRRRIFDLPTARFWRPDPAVDLGFEFLGRRCATPVGPAAGPHSQMAQNLVLAWLAGSRLFELKTVQVLDDLEIARPCIDAQTIGFNIEWSQELTVGQSLAEYTKAWMLLEILQHWEPLSEYLSADPGPFVFDMSVGYDLAGISSEKVASFLRGMGDARASIDTLRPEIRGAFAPFADLDFRPCIADTLTLSTFHGCPPEEIESITKHLIDVHDLDVIVKLNPTLLGYEAVADLLHDQLGYHDIPLPRSAFDADLQFDRAIDLIGELNHYARARGRSFGIKLTNTLVVENHRGRLPEDTMYLSGAPLHVIASALLVALGAGLPGILDVPGHDGDVMVSFSAGITKDNLAGTLAGGANPTTVCTDLLKPGGYGRLAPMLKALTADLATAGHSSLADFRQACQAQAQRDGHPTTAAAHLADILGPNLGDYHRDGNSKLPRAVDHELEMFGCVACNFCVTVCPNDAFTNIKSTGLALGDLTEAHIGRQQYVVFAELCNECGNCMTYCPEQGDPAIIKPRLYTDPELFRARDGQGFLIEGATVVEARSDEASRNILQSLLSSEHGTLFPGPPSTSDAQ